MNACIGPDVYECICCTNHLLVMLHHHNGIAGITQALYHPDESLCVALVQADTRLVEYVHSSVEVAPQPSREGDTLAFAPRECIGETI